MIMTFYDKIIFYDKNLSNPLWQIRVHQKIKIMDFKIREKRNTIINGDFLIGSMILPNGAFRFTQFKKNDK